MLLIRRHVRDDPGQDGVTVGCYKSDGGLRL